MGTWGYDFRQSDDAHDEFSSVLEAAIVEIERQALEAVSKAKSAKRRRVTKRCHIIAYPILGVIDLATSQQFNFPITRRTLYAARYLIKYYIDNELKPLGWGNPDLAIQSAHEFSREIEKGILKMRKRLVRKPSKPWLKRKRKTMWSSVIYLRTKE